MTISDEVKFGVIEGHIVSDCPLVDLVKVLLKLTGIFFCLDTIANAGIISKTGYERVSNFLINIANQNQEEKGSND